MSADNVASVDGDEEDEEDCRGSDDVEDVVALTEVSVDSEQNCVCDCEDRDDVEESRPRLALWNLEWIKSLSSSPISISQ